MPTITRSSRKTLAADAIHHDSPPIVDKAEALVAPTAKADEEEEFSLLYRWLEHDSIDFHLFNAHQATELQDRLLSWYHTHRRQLPWRGDPAPWSSTTTTAQHQQQYSVTPYGIWVSEVMLQQTRVETVIPKWCQWMDAFPTAKDLAMATPEQVNARWAGLGFYARARRLHQAAQQYSTAMPQTLDDWLQLPGVGRYTASAVCTIAYGSPITPAVDGNVCRVVTRLCGVSNTIKTLQTKRHVWTIAESVVQQCGTNSIGDFNQAMMELGATHCAPRGTGNDPQDPLRALYLSNQLQQQVMQYKKKRGSSLEDLLRRIPKSTCCSACSSSDGVAASLERMWEQAVDDNEPCHVGFPLPPPPPKQRHEHYVVAVITRVDEAQQQQFWLRKRPGAGLLAGQWEFPCTLLKQGKKKLPPTTLSATTDSFAEFPHVNWTKRLDDPIDHVFSHVVHTMHVECGFTTSEGDDTTFPKGRWMNEDDMSVVGVTSGVRKILKAVSGGSSPNKKRKRKGKA